MVYARVIKYFKVLFLVQIGRTLIGLKSISSWNGSLFPEVKAVKEHVVDADDLMQEGNDNAKSTEDLGKLDTYSAEEKQVYNTIGLGL
jgi:hypothetical protein